MSIVTYGGGEVLRQVFESIAMIMGGSSGSLFRPLLMMAAAIGGFWAIAKAFMNPSTDALVGKFMLPFLIMSSLLMIPTQSVLIEDKMSQEGHKVDHVPYLLAVIARTVSSVGYSITSAVEAVMHGVNNTDYSSTGMIFGAETFLDAHQYRIADPLLEQNLRAFSKQCVLYDIALGKYSIDEFKKSTDLLDFLAQRSSQVRMMNYLDETGTSYQSCQSAAKAMQSKLSEQVRLFCKMPFGSRYDENSMVKQTMQKGLPFGYQKLLGLSQESEKIVSQLLMMNTISEEYNGNFAKNRAQIQQRATYQTLGSLAGKSLVTMRVVLEALIYASFIFVMPMMLLPGGVGFLSKWVWLAAWIQLWPPFFAILSFIMEVSAQGQAFSFMSHLPEMERGLSFVTYKGINELYIDVSALAGYMSASIPFISYALIQGGVGSFIHLAGSMMTPAHSAAISAASEKVTGNYSFGSVQMGNHQLGNDTSLQRNLAPSMSSGFMSDRGSDMNRTMTHDGMIMQQMSSSTRTSFFSDKNLSSSLQTAVSDAESSVATEQMNYQESLSGASRHMSEFNEHLSRGMSASSGFSTREASDISESARTLDSISESFGNQFGISKREAKDALFQYGIQGGLNGSLGASGKLPQIFKKGTFLGNFIDKLTASAGLNVGLSADSKRSSSEGMTRDEAINAFLQTAGSDDFQTNYQRIMDVASNQSSSVLDDEGARLASAVSRSMDETYSHQESLSSAYSKSQQLSEMQSYVESSSEGMRQDLTQEFINYGIERYADQGGAIKLEQILRMDSLAPERKLLMANFFQDRSELFRMEVDSLSSEVDAYGQYEKHAPGYLDVAEELADLRQFHERTSQDQSFVQGGTSARYDELQDKYGIQTNSVDARVGCTHETTQSARDRMSRNAHTQRGKSLKRGSNFKAKIRPGEDGIGVVNNNRRAERPFFHQ